MASKEKHCLYSAVCATGTTWNFTFERICELIPLTLVEPLPLLLDTISNIHLCSGWASNNVSRYIKMIKQQNLVVRKIKVYANNTNLHLVSFLKLEHFK